MKSASLSVYKYSPHSYPVCQNWCPTRWTLYDPPDDPVPPRDRVNSFLSEYEQVGEFSNMEDEMEQMYTVDPYQFEPVASDSDEQLSYGIDSDSEEDSNESRLLSRDC